MHRADWMAALSDRLVALTAETVRQATEAVVKAEAEGAEPFVVAVLREQLQALVVAAASVREAGERVKRAKEVEND